MVEIDLFANEVVPLENKDQHGLNFHSVSGGVNPGPVSAVGSAENDFDDYGIVGVVDNGLPQVEVREGGKKVVVGPMEIGRAHV